MQSPDIYRRPDSCDALYASDQVNNNGAIKTAFLGSIEAPISFDLDALPLPFMS